MLEKKYTTLRKNVFKQISNNSYNRQMIEGELILLKEKQKRKIDSYQNLKQTISLDAERALVLEKSNFDLLDYKIKIEKCSLYPKRAQLFLNCIISLSKHNHEDFRKYSTEFAEEIKKQALQYKKMQIQQTRQKQIVYNKVKQWIRIVEKTKPDDDELKKQKEISQNSVNDENMKLFYLEEEQETMQQSFEKETPQLSEQDFYDTSLIDNSPLDTANKIFPQLKEQLMELNEERSGRKAS